MKRLNARGDTIIEVLLAIVVVSAVLTGAYITSNHSLKNSRQAQERGEALKYVEAQIEQIKGNIAVASGTGISPFCFKSDGSGTVDSASDSSKCNFGDPSRYHIGVTRDADTYTITATWDNALGTGQDNIKMFYRASS